MGGIRCMRLDVVDCGARWIGGYETRFEEDWELDLGRRRSRSEKPVASHSRPCVCRTAMSPSGAHLYRCNCQLL